ncbi:hypothetical protein DL96DRAFT_1580345 [Flagelloscypha sp. PMI_526]|nr:hypothetical protein DL96DRAFT_1580345 [Flagelloscypha sp. PMI_526]
MLLPRTSTTLRFHTNRLVLSYSFLSRCSSSGSGVTGSAKLFLDAESEETPEAERLRSMKSSALAALEAEHNWDGDERMEDAVLRMLVDKYKPLRSGSIRTAEQKLKSSLPRITPINPSSPLPTPVERDSWKDIPLIEPIRGHRPWHTTYQAPSHATSSIKLGNIPAYKPAPRASLADMDDKTRRKLVGERRRVAHANRLSNAREGTLDYKLGIKKGAGSGQVNPTTMRGWANLVEDKIEKARLSGVFNNVKGRGQPITEDPASTNPFIAREEFLMNRIVQKQGAVPAWIEFQQDLTTALSSFRETLRQSWVRRAFRMITSENSIHSLPAFNAARLRKMRDVEWEVKERGFHETAIGEINKLVMRYNGMAPFTVRKPYHETRAELDAVYDECAEEIEQKLLQRALDGGVHVPIERRAGLSVPDLGDEAEVFNQGAEAAGPTPKSPGILEVLRSLRKEVVNVFQGRDA